PSPGHGFITVPDSAVRRHPNAFAGFETGGTAGLESAAGHGPALVDPATAEASGLPFELGAEEPAGRVAPRPELLDELPRTLGAALPQSEGEGARRPDPEDIRRRERHVPVPAPWRRAARATGPAVELDVAGFHDPRVYAAASGIRMNGPSRC